LKGFSFLSGLPLGSGGADFLEEQSGSTERQSRWCGFAIRTF